MFGSGHIHRLSSIQFKIGSDPSHRSLGEHQRLAENLKGSRVEAGERRAALALKPQVLRDQRAVRQRQQPIVRTVCWQPAFDQYREIIRVEAMEVITVDRHNRPVGVGEDRTTPNMLTARQPWRGCENIECCWVDAFHPSEWWRPTERSHRAAHVPLPAVSLDCHNVPFVVVARNHTRCTGGCIESSGAGLLPPVPAALDGPCRRPIPGV